MAEQDQINYFAACEKLGLTPKPVPSLGASDGDVYDYFAHVLRVCVAAENAIEQPDGSFKEWKAPKDGKTVTYTPWFYKTASGWAYDYYDDWNAYTAVGPRLEYRTREIMRSAVEKLKIEYTNLFNA